MIFKKTVKAESDKKALQTFEYANAAEKVHGSIFNELKETLAGGSDIGDKGIELYPFFCSSSHQGETQALI